MKPKRLIDGGVVEGASKPNPMRLPRTCCRLTLALWAICLVMILVMPANAGDGALDPAFSKFTGVNKNPYLYGKADWTTSGTATAIL